MNVFETNRSSCTVSSWFDILGDSPGQRPFYYFITGQHFQAAVETVHSVIEMPPLTYMLGKFRS